VKEKTGVSPERLVGFYGEYFERFKDAFKNVSVLDLLGLMCVAREPLTLEMVSVLLGTIEKMTQIVTMEAQQLLVLTGDEIWFVRKSMSAYLQDPERNQDDSMHIDEERSHQQLASFCMENLKTSEFAARNMVFHLCKGGQANVLLDLMCDFTWLETVLAEKDMNPRKFVADCDEYFVGKNAGASFDAEVVVRALEKG